MLSLILNSQTPDLISSFERIWYMKWYNRILTKKQILYPNENRLIGKHFAESNIPREKNCTSCGYKKYAKGRQSKKKLATFAENVIDLFVKIVFGNIIPRAH